ncbi:MAG: DUF393 domain-containing protein [Saccharospirillaceae bacterium]|nr:DUF393 domain-containing protein [Pseudomonadales bacterium]NRB81093.1 DUF393 domain-containing protein [Saccharospirillaceae bacterium]
MSSAASTITVFYDGACPKCIKDRRFYERLSGQGDKYVNWLDITGKDALLIGLGIDPLNALSELHIQLSTGKILSELDAYIVLMQRVWLLKGLAWLISLPIIRPYLSKLYHKSVQNRLKTSGRI